MLSAKRPPIGIGPNVTRSKKDKSFCIDTISIFLSTQWKIEVVNKYVYY